MKWNNVLVYTIQLAYRDAVYNVIIQGDMCLDSWVNTTINVGQLFAITLVLAEQLGSFTMPRDVDKCNLSEVYQSNW